MTIDMTVKGMKREMVKAKKKRSMPKALDEEEIIGWQAIAETIEAELKALENKKSKGPEMTWHTFLSPRKTRAGDRTRRIERFFVKIKDKGIFIFSGDYGFLPPFEKRGKYIITKKGVIRSLIRDYSFKATLSSKYISQAKIAIPYRCFFFIKNYEYDLFINYQLPRKKLTKLRRKYLKERKEIFTAMQLERKGKDFHQVERDYIKNFFNPLNKKVRRAKKKYIG